MADGSSSRLEEPQFETLRYLLGMQILTLTLERKLELENLGCIKDLKSTKDEEHSYYSYFDFHYYLIFLVVLFTIITSSTIIAIIILI